MEKFTKVIESINAETTKKETAKVKKIIGLQTTAANKQVREYGKTVSGCVSAILSACQQPNDTMYYTDLKYIVRSFSEVTNTPATKSQIMKNHAGKISAFIGYLQPVIRTNKAGELFTKLTTCTTAKVLKYMKHCIIEALEAKYNEAKAISGELAEKVADEIHAAKEITITETAE